MNISNLFSEDRRDIITAAKIVGAISALLLFPLHAVHLLNSVSFALLEFVVLFLAGIAFFLTGLLLSKKRAVFLQLTKFALIGGLSTAIELALINILFLTFGKADGFWFSFFKALTFCVALLNSYILNKSWAFASTASGIQIEFAKFFLSNMVGLALNVGTASAFLFLFSAPFSVSQTAWANVAVLVAVFVTMTWNFLSYKYLVFSRS